MPTEPQRTPKPSNAGVKEVMLKLAVHKEHNFKWQMVFNTYDIEKLPQGVIVRFAYVQKSGMASEIVPVLISAEGLMHLKDSAVKYLQEFSPKSGSTPLRPIPEVKQFSPLFSNHLNVSKSGGLGEVLLQTILLQDIANVSLGRVPPGTEIQTVEVGLFHSDVPTHERLILDLVSLVA